MAWKYQQTQLPKISVGGDVLEKERLRKKQQLVLDTKANQKLEKSLNVDQALAQKTFLDSVTKAGDVGSDAQMTNNTNQLLLGLSDEYGKTVRGMKAGTIDISMGNAYLSELNQVLDDYVNFASTSKANYDIIKEASGIPSGQAGSFIMNGNMNDLGAIKMIQNLWENPNNMSFVKKGNSMYLQQAQGDGSIKEINLRAFNQAAEEGQNFIKLVSNPDELLKSTLDGIKANTNGWKVSEEITINGVTKQIEKVDVDKLRARFKLEDAWLPTIEDYELAVGTWEYLSRLSQNKGDGAFDTPWFGNELDDNGNLTDLAKSQREKMSNALTELTLSKHVPPDGRATISTTIDEVTPSKEIVIDDTIKLGADIIENSGKTGDPSVDSVERFKAFKGKKVDGKIVADVTYNENTKQVEFSTYVAKEKLKDGTVSSEESYATITSVDPNDIQSVSNFLELTIPGTSDTAKRARGRIRKALEEELKRREEETKQLVAQNKPSNRTKTGGKAR